jgi:hypothetical protein
MYLNVSRVLRALETIVQRANFHKIRRLDVPDAPHNLETLLLSFRCCGLMFGEPPVG